MKLIKKNNLGRSYPTKLNTVDETNLVSADYTDYVAIAFVPDDKDVSNVGLLTVLRSFEHKVSFRSLRPFFKCFLPVLKASKDITKRGILIIFSSQVGPTCLCANFEWFFSHTRAKSGWKWEMRTRHDKKKFILSVPTLICTHSQFIFVSWYETGCAYWAFFSSILSYTRVVQVVGSFRYIPVQQFPFKTK